MKPGRELDALIAEKVMGWRFVKDHRISDSNESRYYDTWLDQAGEDHNLPRYSTDIAAAWLVVEKLFLLGWDTEIQLFKRSDVYEGPFYRVNVRQIHHQENGYVVFTATAQEGVCKAALKAMNIKTE